MIAFFLCGTGLSADKIDFSNRDTLESEPSNNGTVTLSWSKQDATPVILEQASDPDFTTPIRRYEGTASGSVISGLAEGTHFFRVYTPDTSSSTPPLKISVEFVPRDQLFLLLGIGGFVVLATIGAIVIGHFQSQNSDVREGEVAA